MEAQSNGEHGYNPEEADFHRKASELKTAVINRFQEKFRQNPNDPDLARDALAASQIKIVPEGGAHPNANDNEATAKFYVQRFLPEEDPIAFIQKFGL
jgi:hypothetical protein